MAGKNWAEDETLERGVERVFKGEGISTGVYLDKEASSEIRFILFIPWAQRPN